MKKCCRCKEVKDESQFYACPGVYNNLRPECRECTKLKRKSHYSRHQEEGIRVSSVYNKKHPLQTKLTRVRNSQSPKGRYGSYVQNAKADNRLFELSFEQFMTFWQRPCTYCGLEIETIGLDRADNSKGYILDNVAPCCGRCNKMKLKFSVSDFIRHCERIVKNKLKNKEK